MRDLTEGSIESHLTRLALTMAAGLAVTTLYYIVDLYFVAQLGRIAIAGVGAAGNIIMLVMATTQIISSGTLALLSHAVGRKDQSEAKLIFNQSIALALTLSLGALVLGYPLARYYMAAVSADAASAHAGTIYLDWYLPGIAMQFVIAAMGSALQGTGIMRPVMVVQAASLGLNILLAPILIAGWITGHPLGVMGAGLASSIAVFAGVALLVAYFIKLENYVGFIVAEMRPRLRIWGRLLMIGIPAGSEFAFMFFYTAVIFSLIRHFGDAAQAGFGLGTRLTQAVVLPGMAIALAAAPIAGQNFGARKAERVRATLRASVLSCSIIMILLTLFCQWRPDLLVRAFTQDARVVEQGTLYLRIISWNFVATGIIYCCSGMFRAMGNTWPGLISTGSRFFTFILPALWLAAQPHFRIEELWYLSVATVALQAVTSLLLALHEFRTKLSRALPASDTLTVPRAADT